MPTELEEVLIDQAEKSRDTRRQLGELPRTTGIQVTKKGNIKLIVKRVEVKIKNIAGESMIWNNSTFGIWGTNKWGSTAQSSFILGNSLAGILGTSKLGSQSSDWEDYYDSGDLEGDAGYGDSEYGVDVYV